VFGSSKTELLGITQFLLHLVAYNKFAFRDHLMKRNCETNMSYIKSSSLTKGWEPLLHSMAGRFLESSQ